ncbi:MAG TPA: 3-mercaptopyruvate sulfurtransferase [Chakrabartia sp.]|jgi:thiosulfate/3-mercaptopyruvate sulfurtransferase|nr:3-mercaptopyruvate sulfurtransferase [Chakrabartia sp.]
MDALVSTEWLASHLNDADLRILDATAVMPGDPRDPAAEFRAAHMPGARFLSLGTLADPHDPRPMMLPSAAFIEERMGALGVTERDRIVIYDNSAMVSGARAWWMLREIYGAPSVHLLDGGMKAWLSEKRPIESGDSAPAPVRFSARTDRSKVRSKADMLANIASGAAQVADARGAARFSGADPEPRPGMASGHIPGSVNLAYSAMLRPDGRWKRGAELKAAFEAAGLDLTRPLITTCGSGVTACVLALGAHLLGKRDVSVYDGSWSEWGMDPDTPKAVG